MLLFFCFAYFFVAVIILPWIFLLSSPFIALGLALSYLFFGIYSLTLWLCGSLPLAIILDDDEYSVDFMKVNLEKLGYRVKSYTQPMLAMPELLRGDWDLLALHQELPETKDNDVISILNNQKSTFSGPSSHRFFYYTGKAFNPRKPKVTLFPCLGVWEKSKIPSAEFVQLLRPIAT